MVAKLISEEGDLKGLVLSFDNGNEWIIGRDTDECQLVIPDPLISRKHARAYAESEGIYLENLSETNPVLINDEVLNQAQLLHHGDTLTFGNETFRYYVESEAHILDEAYPAEVVHQQELIEAPSEDTLLIEQDDLLASLNSSDEQPPLPNTTLNENSPQSVENDEDTMPRNYNTILQDNDEEFAPLAEINFGLADFGRWLIKVIGGPNNGAEFYMQSGYSYILGTDANTCDIVFHDTSVSRQHAKITVTEKKIPCLLKI